MELLNALIFKYSNYKHYNQSLYISREIEIRDFEYFRHDLSYDKMYKTNYNFQLFIKREFWKKIEDTEEVILQFIKILYWKQITEDIRTSYIIDNILMFYTLEDLKCRFYTTFKYLRFIHHRNM